jgi:hypothetical protein
VAPVRALVAQLLQVQIDWVAEQFRLLDKQPYEASDLAVSLVAALQGALLLSCSLRSPALLDHQIDRLQTWVMSL